METAPFDLRDTGSFPKSPLPPYLVRVKSPAAKAGKVYYVKYITAPDEFEWLLSTVISNNGAQIKLGDVWHYGKRSTMWTHIGAGRNITPSQIDTEITGGSPEALYHLYTLAPRNLAPKPAPSGLSQRKTRRSSRRRSRSRRTRRKY
jgi:hypothetical protein